MKTRNVARRRSKAALSGPKTATLSTEALRSPARPAAPVPSADEIALLAIGRRRHRDLAREFIRLIRAGAEFSDALLAAVRAGFPNGARYSDDVARERGKVVLNREPVYSVVREILKGRAAPKKPRELSALEVVIAYPELLPPCTACGARTYWRQRRDGSAPPFVGCSRYPNCRESLTLAQLEKMLARRNRSSTIAAGRSKELRERSARAPGRSVS